MSDSDNAVEIRNVKKQFSYSHHKNNSLKQAITQVFKKKDRRVNEFYALNGVSFNIKKGEFFGILGRNGSGKSTLLKIISEIYQPTSGSVKHRGSLVSFIELGVGFRAELTGRENVYLNGAMLGFSKKEIDERYDEIVAFAELEDFMDQKIKNYSSGMKVRLAFAVAIQARSDILVLDEVLAVGDASFQRKCYDYFRELKEDKTKTIIFVTHGMGAVREYCDKAVLIENGVVVHEGTGEEIADRYLELFDKQSTVSDKKTRGDGRITVDSVNATVEKDTVLFSVKLTAGIEPPDEEVVFGINVANKAGSVIAGMNNLNITSPVKLRFKPSEKKELTVTMPNIFGSDTYKVNASVRLKDGITFCDQKRDVAQFVNYKKEAYYPIVVPASLEVK
ncbi:MAG TPA: polysaccharide ABC transporter ATP-binding protein [Candidatus Saccharimonadales bacterium]